VTWL